MTLNDLRKSVKARPAAIGQTLAVGGERRPSLACGAMALAVAMTLVLAAVGQAQDQSRTQTQTKTQSQTTEASTGKTSGNYNVQQSVEFGYRDSIINGNLNNYDTFENLNSGVRLFDYTLSMRSINHQGLFFDNLSFANVGYGGDPNDVSRLRINKNKWYDFRAMFRRDKNYWNYSLLANPLNPTSSIPGAAIVNSPHALDLSRRMQDYDLTLFPQSQFRFRLGYSRNTNQGPANTTFEGGTEPVLSESLKYTTNAYRAGMDYRGLPKTTLSFDEMLTYSKVDSAATDNNLFYRLSNGAPVDLGIVFIGTTPCASPITNASTTPPTVSPTCNAYLSYSQVQNPRSSFPTERFSFQSNYIKNLSTNGSASYSSGNNAVTNFNEVVNGWTSRTVAHGSTTGGPAQAKRISVNADWAGDYRVTDRLSIVDEFSYQNWRIPSMWATADTTLFGTPPQAVGQTGMLLPIAMVTPATFATICPTAPYNGPNCPQHNSSSLADVTGELVSRFLGQDIKTNTIEVKYDFTNRVTGRLGYMYTARTIADFNATFDTGEIYFPGGATGSAANDFLAARADCALVAGALPSGCVLNSNGSIQEGSSTNPLAEAANGTSRNLYHIHENAALVGVSARPMNTLRLNADFIFGYNDKSFSRISPRQLQSYKVRATYTPKPWATISGAVDLHENRDNVFTVNNVEHVRTYSFVTTLSPKPEVWVDFGYTYMNIYTQTEICFPDTGSIVFTTPCPVAAATSPLGTLSFYSSKDHYAYGDLMWKPHKRVTAMFGYSGSIVRGNTTFLNPLTPTGTLDFNYLKPLASLAFDIYKGVTYKTAWNYFDYANRGVASPVGLSTIPSQAFNGNNITFSVKYAF